MEIYSSIRQANLHHKRKVAVSMTMDSGAVQKYTYGALFAESDQYAFQLEQSGIKAGDRVILVAENSPQWQIAFLAIMKIRATAVLIDASLGAEELKSLIQKSDARGIYTSEKVKEKLGDSAQYRVPVMNLDKGGHSFKDSYTVLSPFIPKTEDRDPSIALIIYSSGTTRSAAGIMHTHEAMIKTILMTAKENELTSHERILSVLPNSHIYGVVTCLLGSMLLGASVHYVESMNSENVLRAFKTFKPTVFPCVPKVFEVFEKQIIKKIQGKESTRRLYEVCYPICERVREQTGFNLGKILFRSVHKGFGGRLRLMTCAGAPLDEKVAAFYYALGFDLLITYGLTETNIPTIGNRGNNLTINSCGRPYPRIEVILAHPDETGEGEIYIRSPYMMKGYFRDEEATHAAFDEDGWFKTGDLARVDEKGNVQITGRCKENIVLATGKKVAPVDIETHYTAIPGINELVVSGVSVNGEYDEVHAFVVKEEPHLDEKHLLGLIQERGAQLAQYMKVARVHFLEEIPKTSLQKPKRYLLKKHALEAGDKKIIGSEDELNLQEKAQEVTNEHGLDEIIEKLRMLIIEVTGRDENLVTSEAQLISTLGIDSLTLIEIALKIEEIYQLSVETLLAEDPSIKEIADFINDYQIAHKEAEQKNGQVEERKPLQVAEKTNLHYFIFKAHSLLAHLLYRIKVSHSEVLPKDKGYILCANHVSHIDYLWIGQSLDKNQFMKLCCMAKKEIFKDSFIVRLLRDICGMIPVDRSGMNTEVLRLCKKQLEEQWSLLIHPEGTRSEDGTLGSFKKGAATIAIEAGVPIIPVYIKGGYEIFPKGSKMLKLFNWKEKSRYQVEVIYGDPIEPADLSAEVLTQKVEQAIKELMQVEGDVQEDLSAVAIEVAETVEVEEAIASEEITETEVVASEETIETEEVVASEESNETEVAVDNAETVEVEEIVDGEATTETEEVVNSEETSETEEVVDSEESTETEESIDSKETVEVEEVVASEASNQTQEAINSEKATVCVEMLDEEETTEIEELSEEEKAVEEVAITTLVEEIDTEDDEIISLKDLLECDLEINLIEK